MAESAAQSSFEGLVAGIGSDERQYLLQKLRRYGNEAPRQLVVASDEVRDTDTVRKKLESESIIYRFLLWLRAAFTQQKQEDIYNRDLLNSLSRTISTQHPGVIDSQRRLLLTIFFEKLKAMKDCADFFKPFLDRLVDRRGEFYVFLSTLVAPEIAEAIDSDADPYSMPYERTVSADTKSSLLHKLNDTLANVTDVSKQQMRSAILCVEWLRSFTQLHFEHFLSQFTQSGQKASCMFNYAKGDYAQFAKVLANATTISDKVLDALFLFAQDKGMSVAIEDAPEKELQAFTFKAAAKLSVVQTFVSTVPVVSVGRVMMGTYDWNPETFGGGEDWQQVFRARWREVFEERWNAWLTDKKRKEVEMMLEEMFQIDQFPSLKNRPWVAMRSVQFRCEMTAGFIVWFYENEWPFITSALKTLMLEGVFIIPANQTEYSVAANEIADLMNHIGEFAASIAPEGALALELANLAAERTNTINWQSKITGVMLTAEAQVRDIATKLCNQCRIAEKIFHGIFDDEMSSGYDTVRNLTTIKGGDNREFRASLERARRSLSNAKKVLAEIEPLDAPAKSETGAPENA